MQASISSGVFHSRHKPMNFDMFMSKLQSSIPKSNQPIFNTNTDGLWEVYLNSFTDIRDRNEHNCRCCRKFIEDFGGLVTINSRGKTVPFLWNNKVNFEEFSGTVKALYDHVNKSPVTSVFVTDNRIVGTKSAGGWSHMHIYSPDQSLNTNRVLNSSQVSAAKTEDFRMLTRALYKYNSKVADQALSLLKSEQLIRSEAALSIAEWFVKLHASLTTGNVSPTYTNKVWAAVGSAPAGFCNISSSMIGSLMDDLVSGYDFPTVAKRYSNKMNPNQYRRPQTAPGAQNVKRGEEIIKAYGYERSLERRYARLTDLQLLWQPWSKPTSLQASQGVFRDVVIRDQEANGSFVRSTAPATLMTFEKFKRKVLPTADKIFIDAPSKGNYSALLTAEHSDAPNMLQWSNPVSWYVYSGGSSASSWGLKSGAETEVTGITLQPNMWNDECPDRGEGVHFLLKDAADTRSAGLGLFPEILKSELHSIRKTIESFSNSGTAKGRRESQGNGIKFGKDGKDLIVKVVSKGIMTTYRLDRMD